MESNTESCRHTLKGWIFCILGILASKYIKEGDAEVAPMENPADYQYDINVAEVAGLGVVAVWSVLGCLILPLMYYAAIESLASSMGELAIVVRVVGLFTLLWTLVYLPLLSLLPYLNDSIQTTRRICKPCP